MSTTQRDELVRELVNDGLSERSAKQMATAMLPLGAFVQVNIPGNENGPAGTAELHEDSYGEDGVETPYLTISDGIPHTVGAGGHVSLLVNAPNFSDGSLTLHYAELGVSNAAGTQKLIVNGNLSRAMASGEAASPITGLTQVEKIGTDLAYANGIITSTAGGQFIVYAIVSFAVQDLAA